MTQRVDLTVSRVLVALAAAILAGCVWLGPPAHVSVVGGNVRADTHAEARRVAGMVAWLRPAIEARLPGVRAAPVEVWVRDLRGPLELPERMTGATLTFAGRHARRRSYIFADGDGPSTLAHELVHAMVDETWHRLPAVLEEGLCDFVAGAVTGEESEPQKLFYLRSALWDFELVVRHVVSRAKGTVAQYKLPVSTVEKGEWTVRRFLALESEDFLELQDGPAAAAYALGELMIGEIERRIGLEGLYALCLRAQGEGLDSVPFERLLEASGVDGDSHAWLRIAMPRCTPEFLRSIAIGTRVELAQAIVSAARASAATWGLDVATAELWLEQSETELIDLEAGTSLFVKDVPELCAAIVAAW